MAIFDYGITKDNPGAYTFLKESCGIDVDLAEKVFERLRDNDITGQALYILWNDCFSQNTEMALRVLEKDPVENILYHLNNANETIENRGIPYGTK